MKRVLVVTPSAREKREIEASGINTRFDVVYDEDTDDFFEERLYDETGRYQDFDLKAHIAERLAVLKSESFDGVISALDHPGSALAAIYARELGLKGPDPDIVIRSQHKFEARKQQAALVPQATPAFALVDPREAGLIEAPLPYPFFIKPVKGRFSAFSRPVMNEADWRSLRDIPLLPPENFRKGFNALLEYVGPVEGNADYLIAESLLDGVQVTLDGFVTHSEVQILGIVDSHMYPNTISFSRFQHPSALPESVQKRMGAIAKTYIEGIGMNETMFNIEFFYNQAEDSIHIIEMNPRLASGFADIYEKVHGSNLFELGMVLACGEVIQFKAGTGSFDYAASFVERVFADGLVRRIPSDEDVASFMARFPEARLEVCVKEGGKLSDKMQDVSSFRYALMHLGGKSVDDLEARYAEAKEMLPFEFAHEEVVSC